MAGGPGALDMLNGSAQVGTASIGDSIVPGGLLQGIPRSGVTQSTDLPVQALELALMVAVLPPALLLVGLCQTGADGNQLANGIQQQVQVCRIVDIGLDNERVTPANNRFIGWFDLTMSGLDHNLIDTVEYVRSEQPKVIPQRLERVPWTLLPLAMTKEQTKRLMFVRQVTNPVVVGVE